MPAPQRPRPGKVRSAMVVVGDVFSGGFECYGPFESLLVADEWAAENFPEETGAVTVELINPAEVP